MNLTDTRPSAADAGAPALGDVLRDLRYLRAMAEHAGLSPGWTHDGAGVPRGSLVDEVTDLGRLFLRRHMIDHYLFARRLAVGLRARDPGVSPLDLADAFDGLRAELTRFDRPAAALEVSARAVALLREPARDGEPASRHRLALALRDRAAVLVALGRAAEAWQALEEAVALCRELVAERGPHRETIETLTAVLPGYEPLIERNRYRTLMYTSRLDYTAGLQSRRGLHEDAARTAERAVAVARTLPPGVHLARALGRLGHALDRAGDHEAAERAGREAVELWRKAAERLPDRFTGDLAAAWRALGDRLGVLDRTEEAAAATLRARWLYRPGHCERPDTLASFAVHLDRLGRPAAARDAAREAADGYTALGGDGFGPPSRLAAVLADLSDYHETLGEAAEAAEVAGRATEILDGLYASAPRVFERALLEMLPRAAARLAAVGDLAGAASAAGRHVEVLERRKGRRPDTELGSALVVLGGHLAALGRYEEAGRALRRAEGRCADVPPLRALALSRLARCRHRLGATDEAVRILRRGVAVLKPAEEDERSPYPLELGVLLTDLSRRLRDRRRPIEALGAAGRAVALCERLPAEAHHVRALCLALREKAQVLIALDRDFQAESLLRRAEDLDPPG